MLALSPLYCRYHLFGTHYIVYSNEEILYSRIVPSYCTQRSYKAGIRQYIKFCRDFTFHSIPTSERTLLLFATYVLGNTWFKLCHNQSIPVSCWTCTCYKSILSHFLFSVYSPKRNSQEVCKNQIT